MRGRNPRSLSSAAVNGFAASLNAGQLNALQHNPNVEYVEQDQAYEARALNDRVPALAEKAVRTRDVLLVAEPLGSLGSADEARSLALAVRAQLGDAASVVALVAEVGGKPIAIVATSPSARDAGADAGALAKAMARVLGGGGGGKPDLAQGGGSDLSAIPTALDTVRRELGG